MQQLSNKNMRMLRDSKVSRKINSNNNNHSNELHILKWLFIFILNYHHNYTIYAYFCLLLMIIFSIYVKLMTSQLIILWNLNSLINLSYSLFLVADLNDFVSNKILARSEGWDKRYFFFWFFLIPKLLLIR